MQITVLVQKSDYEEFIGGLEHSFNIKAATSLERDDGKYANQYRLDLEKKEIKEIRKSPGRKMKFTDAEVEVMRTMKEAGISIREIAKRMNVAPSTIINYMNPEKRNNGSRKKTESKDTA